MYEAIYKIGPEPAFKTTERGGVYLFLNWFRLFKEEGCVFMCTGDGHISLVKAWEGEGVVGVIGPFNISWKKEMIYLSPLI